MLNLIDLIDTKQCKIIICKYIDDLTLQSWYTEISISPMCTLYIIFLTYLLLLSIVVVYPIPPCIMRGVPLLRPIGDHPCGPPRLLARISLQRDKSASPEAE